MPSSFTIRDKTGRQLDRVQANSREEAFKIYKAKKPNIQAKTAVDEPTMLGKAWDWATHEYLPEHKFNTGSKVVDRVADMGYEYGVRPMSSPLGAATTVISPLKLGGTVGKAMMRGLKAPVDDAAAIAYKTAKAAAKAAGKPAPKMKILSRIIDEGKGSALTTGFPGTNISYHGASLGATAAMATPLREGGLIKGAARTARLMLSQKYAAEEHARLAAKPITLLGQALTKPGGRAANGRKLPRVPMTMADLAKAGGLNLEHNQQAGARTAAPLLTAGKFNPLRFARNVQEEIFDKPLFGDYVPVLKYDQFERVMENLTKKLKPQTQAELVDIAKTAGETGNKFYGGLGKGGKWDKGGMKYIYLAPDWYERHVQLGKGIAKAIANPKDPRGDAYRTFAKNIGLTMGLMDVANKTMSGHHLWENQPGKNFQIDTGRLDEHGQRAHIDLTAGGLDFVRLPIDVLHAMVKGGNLAAPLQVIQNRLNVVNRAALDMIGANYKPAIHRYQFPKRERDPKTKEMKLVYGPPLKQQAVRVVEDIIDNFAPGPFQVAEDLIHQGERDRPVGKAQGIAKSLELFLKFSRDRRPETETKAESRARAKDLAKARKKKKREEAIAKRKGGG